MSYPITAHAETEHGLAPIRPRNILVEKAPVDLSMRGLYRYARMSKSPGKPTATRPTPEWSQRCAVQLRYTKGGSVGKWFSKGAYIARESATKGQGSGFDAKSADVPVAKTVASWRRSKDQLLFRLILSPEFGERLDLQEFARSLMARMEVDLKTKLQWVAVSHYNTDNPHVHVLLRGKRDNGKQLRIPREYVKEDARHAAEEIITFRLGHRSKDDIWAAQKREVTQSRYTGLDRRLKKREAESPDGQIVVDHKAQGLSEMQSSTEFHLLCRLRQLQQMGLATETGGSWTLNPEMEQSLRAVQKSIDRIKTMEAHGVMASDSNMPFRVLKPDEIEDIEGRILVHGEDEHSGNNFALIETVQGEILRVPHVRELANARQRGQLDPGRYMKIQKTDQGFKVEDFGDSDQLLADQTFVIANRERLAKVVPEGFPGWLGALRRVVDGTGFVRSKTR